MSGTYTSSFTLLRNLHGSIFLLPHDVQKIGLPSETVIFVFIQRSFALPLSFSAPADDRDIILSISSSRLSFSRPSAMPFAIIGTDMYFSMSREEV